MHEKKMMKNEKGNSRSKKKIYIKVIMKTTSQQRVRVWVIVIVNKEILKNLILSDKNCYRTDLW